MVRILSKYWKNIIKIGRQEIYLAYLFIFPGLFAILSLLLYPLIFGIRTSFFRKVIGAPGQFIGLANYQELFSSVEFWEISINSAIWTSVGVAGGIFIGLALALLLNTQLKGRMIGRTLFLIPWAVPNVAAAIIWRWIFANPYGFLNHFLRIIGIVDRPIPWLSSPNLALWAVIIVAVWRNYPFAMIVILASLQSIPEEYYEVSQLDGAGVWQRFRHVTLPLIKPTLLIVTILQTIWTFNSFDIVYVMTQGGPQHYSEILSTFAYEAAFEAMRAGRGAAIASIMFGVLIVCAIIYMNVYWRWEEVR